MCYIELKDVAKFYPAGGEKTAALAGVSMKVKQGEFIAVTGPSGCGKSTLLHIVGGLNRPSSGCVFVGGKSLYDRNKGELAFFRRREVGIVYQFYNLVPELTAIENLILPALMDRKMIDKELVNGILDILGMTDKQNLFPGQLSGGQQQKIAVGRALISHPALLLADEPTGNLDSAKRNEILKLFQYLNEQEGMTILLVTHDDTVAQAAKRRIHMLDGRIVRDEVQL